MLHRTEEEREWERLADYTKKMKAVGWKAKAIPTLKSPVDIVVINKDTKVLESVTSWTDVSDYARAERLIARESGQYGDSLIVGVNSRVYSRGDIINNKSIVL